MFKSIVVINLVALALTFVSMFWLYVTHTNIVETKNEHLIEQKLNEVNKLENIDKVKSSFKEILLNQRNSINTHNKEVKYSVYILLSVVVILILNLALIFRLNRETRK